MTKYFTIFKEDVEQYYPQFKSLSFNAIHLDTIVNLYNVPNSVDSKSFVNDFSNIFINNIFPILEKSQYIQQNDILHNDLLTYTLNNQFLFDGIISIFNLQLSNDELKEFFNTAYYWKSDFLYLDDISLDNLNTRSRFNSFLLNHDIESVNIISDINNNTILHNFPKSKKINLPLEILNNQKIESIFSMESLNSRALPNDFNIFTSAHHLTPSAIITNLINILEPTPKHNNVSDNALNGIRVLLNIPIQEVKTYVNFYKLNFFNELIKNFVFNCVPDIFSNSDFIKKFITLSLKTRTNISQIFQDLYIDNPPQYHNLLNNLKQNPYIDDIINSPTMFSLFFFDRHFESIKKCENPSIFEHELIVSSAMILEQKVDSSTESFNSDSLSITDFFHFRFLSSQALSKTHLFKNNYLNQLDSHEFINLVFLYPFLPKEFKNSEFFPDILNIIFFNKKFTNSNYQDYLFANLPLEFVQKNCNKIFKKINLHTNIINNSPVISQQAFEYSNYIFGTIVSKLFQPSINSITQNEIEFLYNYLVPFSNTEIDSKLIEAEKSLFKTCNILTEDFIPNLKNIIEQLSSNKNKSNYKKYNKILSFLFNNIPSEKNYLIENNIFNINTKNFFSIIPFFLDSPHVIINKSLIQSLSLNNFEDKNFFIKLVNNCNNDFLDTLINLKDSYPFFREPQILKELHPSSLFISDSLLHPRTLPDIYSPSDINNLFLFFKDDYSWINFAPYSIIKIVSPQDKQSYKLWEYFFSKPSFDLNILSLMPLPIKKSSTLFSNLYFNDKNPSQLLKKLFFKSFDKSAYSNFDVIYKIVSHSYNDFKEYYPTIYSHFTNNLKLLNKEDTLNFLDKIMLENTIIKSPSTSKKIKF